jgi:RNA polymerase sigma-70 factor (family 1)
MLKSSSFNIEKIKKEIGRSDRLAFRELFNNYYPRLLNYSFVIIKNHESAEDIVLEVLHSIWVKRDKLKWIERFETYLYVCTKNKTLDQIRKNSKFLNVSFSKPHYKEYITHQNPEIQYLNMELLEIVDIAILNLPKKTRLVYRLIKEDGLKYQEVADVLGVSVKTINNQLVCAVKSVRETVTNYFCEQKHNPVVRSLKSLSFLKL